MNTNVEDMCNLYGNYVDTCLYIIIKYYGITGIINTSNLSGKY